MQNVVVETKKHVYNERMPKGKKGFEEGNTAAQKGEEKLEHRVMIRLTDTQLERLDCLRGKVSRADYLRALLDEKECVTPDADNS